MTRLWSITGFFTALFAAASVAGCTLEDSTLTSSTGQHDLPNLESGHYVVMRVGSDGLFEVARAGFKQTRCSDGVMRSTCAVAELDLSRVDLRADDDRLARARIADGSAVVLAKLGSSDSVRDGVLVVSQIWARDVASPARWTARLGTDPLYVLRDVHEGCDGEPEACAWLRTEPVNGDGARHYTTLDLEQIGNQLTDEQRDELRHGRLLAHGAGIGSAFLVASVLRVFPHPQTAPSMPVAVTTFD